MFEVSFMLYVQRNKFRRQALARCSTVKLTCGRGVVVASPLYNLHAGRPFNQLHFITVRGVDEDESASG